MGQVQGQGQGRELAVGQGQGQVVLLEFIVIFSGWQTQLQCNCHGFIAGLKNINEITGPTRSSNYYKLQCNWGRSQF